MPLYEHVFIARQDISGAQVDTITDQFSDIVKEQGGSVEKKEYWGLRNLAYRIKKNRKGHYVLLNIDAPSAAVHELERQERIHDDVLRYLTLRIDEFEEGESAMMQGKSGRGRREDGERGRDDGRPDRSGRPPAAAAKEPEAKTDAGPEKTPAKTVEQATEKTPGKTVEQATEKTPETTSGNTDDKETEGASGSGSEKEGA